MKTEKSKETEDSGAKSSKRATIYGSSLLKSLQTPERQQLAEKSQQLEQQKKNVNQQHVYAASAKKTPSPKKTPTRGRVGKTRSRAKRTPRTAPGQPHKQGVTSTQVPVIPGQQASQIANQTSPGGAGAQLCLKFVKATGPDGKPGLTAILGASPNPPAGARAGVSVLPNQTPRTATPMVQNQTPRAMTPMVQNQTPGTGTPRMIHPSAVTPRMQTPGHPQQPQPQTMMQLSGPPRASLASAMQKNLGQGLPSQVPIPVAGRPSQDETQAAVAALLSSSSSAGQVPRAEPRMGNWKNRPRSGTAPREEDLAKTEKLLNALRTLMSQQRTQVQTQQQQPPVIKLEPQDSPSMSVQQTSTQMQSRPKQSTPAQSKPGPNQQTSAQSQSAPNQQTSVQSKPGPNQQTPAKFQSGPNQQSKETGSSQNSKSAMSNTSQANKPSMNSQSQASLMSEVLSAVQLQASLQAGPSSGNHQSGVRTADQESQMQTNKEPAHQLPPDDDRFGLKQEATLKKRKPKVQGKTTRKRVKRIPQVSPEEALQYLESVNDHPQYTESTQQIEARVWNSMIRNIDVFMFPVYRCKLCPNYYTTVKPTMVEHMKDVHRGADAEQEMGDVGLRQVVEGGEGGVVDEAVQNRVKNIQNIFERKLRSQAGGTSSAGDGDGDSVSSSQNSFVEIPFSSGNPREEGGNGSIGDNVDENDVADDDDDPGVGGFEDVDDDDDYDPGEGGFEDVDDDDDDGGDGGAEEGGDGEEEADNVSGGVRRSRRLVRLSSTPMIRKYHHRKTSAISPRMGRGQKKKQADNDRGKRTAGDKKDQKMTTENREHQEEGKKNWPRVVLTKTPVKQQGKEKNATKSKKQSAVKKSPESNKDDEVEMIVKEDGDEEVKIVEQDKEEEVEIVRNYWNESTKRYIEDEEEEKDNEAVEIEEESVEEVEEVDKRDLNEVRPPMEKQMLNTGTSKPRPNKMARLQNKKKTYFQPGNKHYTKRVGFNFAKQNPEEEVRVKLPPVERPKTRSQARGRSGFDGEESEMLEVAQGKNRVCISRYEAWKKIGLDPNSEPPWPCTHPGCGYYFASLGSFVAHHVWKHDTFGDRNQRILARDLGEKYSLFEKPEKRAVPAAKFSVADEKPDGESAGVAKSKRKKKPVKRLSSVLIGKNNNFSSKVIQMKDPDKKRKRFRCKYCKRFFLSPLLRGHMRIKHKAQWMKDNNLTQEDLDEIAKNHIENGDEESANMSLLATVADKLEDKVNLDCKRCSFKAVSEKGLARHIDMAHPEYIRSIYSDSEDEDDKGAPAADGDQDVTPSNRPVRKCRRKALPKLLQKEKKLDKVIPLPDIDEKSDDDGDDGGYLPGRSGVSLQCIECNYIAIEDKSFIAHMKSVHKEEVVLNYQCDHEQCDFVGTGRQSFIHKRTHVKTIMCDMCGKTCKGEKRFKMHKQFHCGKEKPGKKKPNLPVVRTCNVCPKDFYSIGTFQYHMAGHRTDEVGGTFACNICGKRFKQKQSVKIHILSAHTEGQHKCDHCSFSAVYQSKLKWHLFEKHDMGGEDLPDFKCTAEGCSFTTKSSKQLSHHKRKHNMNRFKYWCDGCNQPIRTLKSLARHQVLHRDGVKKYKCKECGYQATNSNTLSSHKATKHRETEKNVICDLCGKSFMKRSALFYHKKIMHTEEKTFKCKFCEQKFKFHSQQVKHVREEHPTEAAAAEAAQMEEAKKIINAPPKRRGGRRKAPGERKKRIRKPKPSTGRKVGRPKVPLTPELIAQREELKRQRNKRKYENRKAKLKRLGLKRKKYPSRKGQAGGASTRTRRYSAVSSTVSTVDSNDFYSDEEVAAAAQQLESIAQTFTAQPPQTPPRRLKSPRRAEFPVHVEPTRDTYQLTALNHDFNIGASTSASTLHIHPPISTQEVTAPTDVIAGGNTQHLSTPQRIIPAMEATQRIIPALDAGQTLQGRPGEQPVNYLEVTTVHTDGTKHVEMWPVWQE